MKKKLILALILGLASAALSVLLYSTGIFESLELKALDYRFHQFTQSERASKDIVIAVIDEKSIQGFKDDENQPWPWSRDFYSALVNYFKRGGAKVVLFDILFDNPDIQRMMDQEDTDGKFSRAMQGAGNVVLAVHFRKEEILIGGSNVLHRESTVLLSPPDRKAMFTEFTDAVLPIDMFQRSAAGLGFANYYQDPQDGVCRRVPLFSLYRDEVFPQLGAAGYLLGKDLKGAEIRSKNLIRLGDLEIPVDDEGKFLITWYGKGGPDAPFRYYSIRALIQSACLEEQKKEPVIPCSEFKDKYVFVGSNAAGLFDLQNTPFTVYAPYPGTEIHATLLSNLLQRDFLVRVRPWPVLGAMSFFALSICLLFLLVPKIRYVALVTVIFAAGWFYLTCHVFQHNNLWLDVIGPEFSVLVSFLTAAVASYQTEGKARRRVRSVFSRYLNPLVVSELLEKSDELQLGGKEIVGTVFFSDIKDFTALSERKKPTEVVKLLNDYFATASDIILRNDGLLDKYLGDSVMAIFGAPISHEKHAIQACNAAVDLQRSLNLTKKTTDGVGPALGTRIGINTGSIVVGNIGSSKRMDYTAIGDAVNLASRLEGVNKIYGSTIIISQATYDMLGDQFVARELDLIRVKGKNKEVIIYELLDRADGFPRELLPLLAAFQEGVRLYRSRSFEKALGRFREVLKTIPIDGPALEYVRRCTACIAAPPPPDWDAVHQLEVK